MNTRAEEFKTFRKYMRKECLISYGVINGIINGLIYYFIARNGSNVNLHGMTLNLAFTFVLMTLILALCIYPILKLNVKKGAVPHSPYIKEEHWIFSVYPENRYGQMFLTMIVATIICTLVMGGLGALLDFNRFDAIGGSIFKGVGCTLCGAVTAYFVEIPLLFTMSDKNA